MSFLTGSSSSKNSWKPVITGDTTTSSYWLNWRFLLCSIWILLSLVIASLLISKYECPQRSRTRRERDRDFPPGIVYEDEVWMPCLNTIHPAWLFIYRVIAFMVLFLMLLLNVAVDGGQIFYYYTQWTFTLVTVYFGLGSLLSMYGCNKYYKEVRAAGTEDGGFDIVPGPTYGAKGLSATINRNGNDRGDVIAGFWGYLLQIIFQMNAGAVLLTDIVFWFIIVPFLAIKDYNLNLVIISMHSINAVFLFGETALNSLRFPVFRIAYFVLWTAVYVIFQWIVHACISIWWPYPFLDLSAPLSPLWYTAVAVMHIPCYGVFLLIMKLKHCWLLRCFPQSYPGAL